MADDARNVAFDPAVPAGERYDAQVELAKAHHAPNAQTTAEALQIVSAIREQMALDETASLMAKASGAQIIQFPGQSRKKQAGKPIAVQVDNFQVSAMGEYYEPQGGLNFDVMKRMVAETPILSAIVLTRIRQVARFAGISEDGGPGFEIVHRDREHQPTDGERAKIRELRRFFENCGSEWNPRKRKKLRRDNFAGFLAKITRETLTYDAYPIETIPKLDRARGLDGFIALDGSSIRLCSEEGYEGDDDIFALQVIDGRLHTAFSYDRLVYEVRNPRADVTVAGYGMGEPELLVRIVTGFLNALTYNTKSFDDNAIPKGILHLSGAYKQEDVDMLKRYWNAQVRGINNAWTLPVMVAPDENSKATFTPFNVGLSEMAYSKFITLLTAIAAAIYGMAPDEINFESFSAQRSSLSGEDTTEKLADSKDKGLHSLLGHLQNTFTDFLLPEDVSTDFMFRFQGLTSRDQAREEARKMATYTVNELRAEMNQGPHPDETLGGAPLNPQLVGPWMQMRQQAQRPEGQDFGGAPGGDFGQEDAAEGEPDGEDEGGGPGDGGGAPNGDGAPPPETGAGPSKGDFGKSWIYSVEPG